MFCPREVIFFQAVVLLAAAGNRTSRKMLFFLGFQTARYGVFWRGFGTSWSFFFPAGSCFFLARAIVFSSSTTTTTTTTTLAIAGEICPSMLVLLLLTQSIQKLQKHGTTALILQPSKIGLNPIFPGSAAGAAALIYTMFSFFVFKHA